MASSRLVQFRAKAAEASKLLTENGATYYKQLLEMNQKQAQQVQERLSQFRSKATETSKQITENGATYYRQLSEMNQQQARQVQERLWQFRAKAGESSKLITENGAAYYKQLRELNRHQVEDKVLQFRAKAADTPNLVTKNVATYYRNLLERKQQYVLDPPTVETCQKLEQQLFYTCLACIPHQYGLLRSEVEGLKQLIKNWRGLTAQHYGLFTLFGFECLLWAWLGQFMFSNKFL